MPTIENGVLVQNGMTVNGTATFNNGVIFASNPAGLITNGNGITTTVTTAATTSLTSGTSNVNVNITTGTEALTLPQLSTMAVGQILVICRQVSTGTITITPHSGDSMMISGTGLVANPTTITMAATAGITYVFLKNGFTFWTVIKSA